MLHARWTGLLIWRSLAGLKVLEDVAQAAGGSFRGQRLGSIGDVGAFSFQFNKIITCGEGGIAITNNSEIYERLDMYHDVVGGLRNGIPNEKILNGMNFRMSELHGAIMLVQLRRLPGLLMDMRQRKAALKCAIKDMASRKGVLFRTINDADGDTATSLVFFAPTAERASRIAALLNAMGVGALVLYQPDRVDYHVYPHWTPIMEKRTWSENGGPWRWHDGEVKYSRGYVSPIARPAEPSGAAPYQPRFEQCKPRRVGRRGGPSPRCSVVVESLMLEPLQSCWQLSPISGQ